MKKYLVHSWLLALSQLSAAATETLPGNNNLKKKLEFTPLLSQGLQHCLRPTPPVLWAHPKKCRGKAVLGLCCPPAKKYLSTCPACLVLLTPACSCLPGPSWSFLVLPGPAYSCLVLPPPAWSCSLSLPAPAMSPGQGQSEALECAG